MKNVKNASLFPSLFCSKRLFFGQYNTLLFFTPLYRVYRISLSKVFTPGSRTLVHGYPYKPTAMAFDPVQKVLAIGNKEGVIKLLGKRGIDLTFQHESKR